MYKSSLVNAFHAKNNNVYDYIKTQLNVASYNATIDLIDKELIKRHSINWQCATCLSKIVIDITKFGEYTENDLLCNDCLANIEKLGNYKTSIVKSHYSLTQKLRLLVFENYDTSNDEVKKLFSK